MQLDINAFRAIANQSPDKLVYVQGETLKTTRNEAHHGAHTYKAATDAFLAAYRQHYGAILGDALKRHLETEGNAGKPLTARTIKALVAFADEKIGSATHVDAAGKSVKLDEVGTDDLSRVGWSQAGKIAKAEAGQKKAAAATLAALKFGPDGKVDLEAMLRHLNTFHAYVEREIEARELCEVRPSAPMKDLVAPGAVPDAPGPVAPAAPAETRSDAEVERAKLFEKGLFTAVDAMDNNALSAVYQGLISKQTDGFKKELARIINHPDVAPATKALAEKAFADLSRVEAMIVSEISRRMILDKTPENEKANVPSLMERYAGAGAPTANHYAGDRDMSTVNLAIMADAAAKGSSHSKTANAKTDATLSSHGMGAVDSKKIGDMLRSQELTVNMKFAALMGYRRSGEKAPSLFKRPNAHLVNTFESKEEQGLDLLGSGLLKHRDAVEKCFFPEYGEKPIQGKDRPVYGALNTIKMTSGAADTHGGIYGRVVVVMRQHVKQNCTYTLDDSFWTTRLSLPEAKRAEMEEMLVAAFASRLKDPAAALADLRTPGSDAYKAVSYFYTQRGAATTNLSAHNIDTLVNQMVQFLKKHLKDGEREVEDSEIYAHFTEQHALKTETQSKIAGYDNIENLLAQECDFTALSMGIATLRQQENPKSPAAFEGCAYIEAQFHGPVLLDRDVEEIRIDTFEMKEHFERMFSKLPKAERDALDEDAWVQARFDEAVAEIKADTKNAPFKVVFYDSEKTLEAEGDRVYKASKSQNKEAVSLLKDDLVALGEAFKGERFAEVADRVARNLSGSRKEYIAALVGERLEKIPDWLMEAIRQMMDKAIATFGTDVNVFNENKIFDTFVRGIGDLLAQLDTSLMAMDPAARNDPKAIQDLLDLGFAGRDLTVADPQARLAILKEIVRAPMMSPTQALAYVEIHVAGEKALADVNAFVRETFEKDIEGGADLVKWAFGGLPPVSGAAERAVAQRIQNEIRAIKADLSGDKLRTGEMKQGKLVERLRKRAVQPFIEPKARILAGQVHMKFPSQAERNAFLAWAASAGKIKTEAEFVGVYEGSTLLADSLTAKIAAGAPLSAQDLVDGFKAFIPTAFDYMLEDAKGRAEYGPDDRQNFVGRIVSVALSRLAERIGREGLAKIAAALDTPDARWLHTALAVGNPENVIAEDLIRQGTFETAAAFFEILHQRLSSKFDLPTHPTNPPSRVTYALVPPAIRALVAQINPAQAQELGGRYPYAPAASGARRLGNIPAPANPAAMPQNNAGRKEFLLRMLPTYHNHEKTFDRGTNYHGRTHATRAFVFSIAMGNILREKGVPVDLNAVALATAGHDTGRTKNGRDTAGSEKRSADNTVAAVNATYPGAAGPGWTAQIQANITSTSAGQDTIEGYLFKSADSLDYSRIDELDEAHFPFLKEPIATADGLVLPVDKGIRRQLMKEAKLLTELTSPRTALEAEHRQLMVELANLQDGPEYQAKNARLQEIVQQMQQSEIAQTDTLTDRQVVELVENAIRSRPQDFPLLSKYYLGAK